MNARDIGSEIVARASGAVDVTAGGAGDATELDGPWIDRQGYQSGKLVIHYKATLAQDETLSIAANLQDASDDQGTGVADFGTPVANAVVATGGAGGSVEEGVVELDVNLSAAKQYVRSQFTPDLSAAVTDTAIVSAELVLGGADVTPAT